MGCTASKLTECSLGVVDPVRRKEAAEGRDKVYAAVVRDGQGHLVDGLGVRDEAQVVQQKRHAGACHGDAALERVHGFPPVAEVVRDRGEQAALGDDGLGPHVVEQEAAGAVRVLRLAGVEAALADEGGRLVAQTAGDGDTLEGPTGERSKGRGV